MDLVLKKESERTPNTFALPAAPTTWLRLHSVATGASLAAGALAFSLTHIAGSAATTTLSNSITIGGSVCAYMGRWIGGDLVGMGIQTGARTASVLVEEIGETTTQIGGILASTVAAVAVGSAFLIGNTLYDIYSESRISKPFIVETLSEDMPLQLIESIEELEEGEEDYVVYHSVPSDPALTIFPPLDMASVD